MTLERVDAFLIANQKYFPPEKMTFLRDKLLSIDESRMSALVSIDFKDPTVLLLVSIFVGGLGIDRFMLGDIGMGVLKLLTAGLCGVLTIIDWFTIMGKTKELNFNNFMNLL